MRKNRQPIDVVLVLLVALVLAPGALAEPVGASHGSIAAWWQGAAAWGAERLSELGRLVAEAGGEEPSGDDGAGTGEEDPGYTVMTTTGGGTETESGPHWDPDG